MVCVLRAMESPPTPAGAGGGLGFDRNADSSSRVGFFNHGTINIWGQIILRVGAALCNTGCSPASLVSTL